MKNKNKIQGDPKKLSSFKNAGKPAPSQPNVKAALAGTVNQAKVVALRIEKKVNLFKNAVK